MGNIAYTAGAVLLYAQRGKAMMDYAAMGRRIVKARLGLGLRQEDMAKLVKISASFYGHIERGTRIPSVETLSAIAEALHTSMDSLTKDLNDIHLSARGVEPLRDAAKNILAWCDQAEKAPEEPPQDMGFRKKKS